MLIAPPQVHMHLLPEQTTGPAGSITVGLPGVHGDATTGMHGAGVGTPKAAAVIAITIGFVGAVHIENDITLTIGMIFVMQAIGMLHAVIGGVGRIVRGDGAAPNEHWHIAPHTATGILS